MNRTALFPLAVVATLSACAPLSIYYRPGTSVARMQEDQTRCEVQALQQAPVANRIRRDPPIFVPPRQYCDSVGNCWVRPGHWVPGEVYTVDVNSDLRARVENLCMAEKGYSPVNLPACPPEVKEKTPPGTTTVLPKLTETACVIRNKDGSWQIVAAQ